jgi:hypothetical protein
MIQDGKIEINVTVPPNTKAIVSLPRQEENPIEVQAGTHRWSYDYEDPDARQSLSVENTIGEIRDDQAAWAALKAVLNRLIPENGFIVYVFESQRKRRLRDGLATLPNDEEVLQAVSEAFAELGNSR